jgi:hypothetical protein
MNELQRTIPKDSREFCGIGHESGFYRQRPSYGEAVESYLDIKLSVPESRYTNWPPALQQQFADARTVEAGKPSFHISPDSEV